MAQQAQQGRLRVSGLFRVMHIGRSGLSRFEGLGFRHSRHSRHTSGIPEGMLEFLGFGVLGRGGKRKVLLLPLF